MIDSKTNTGPSIQLLLEDSALQDDPLASEELETFLVATDQDNNTKISQDEWEKGLESDQALALFGPGAEDLRSHVFEAISRRFLSSSEASVSGPSWSEDSDWRWNVLGTLDKELSIDSGSYDRDTASPAVAELAGLMEVADGLGVGFGEAYQTFADYAEQARQTLLVRKTALENQWNQLPVGGGSEFKVSDQRFHLTAKEIDINSPLNSIPHVVVDGPGADLTCREEIDPSSLPRFLVVVSDRHTFKLNGTVYSHPGTYIFRRDGSLSLSSVDETKTFAYQEGELSQIVKSRQRMEIFKPAKLMAHADTARVSGDEQGYRKNMMALADELRRFGCYETAASVYGELMRGMGDESAKTALADMRGEGKLDLADHTTDILTKEALTGVAMMVGAGEVGLVGSLLARRGMLTLAEKIGTETASKVVMKKVLMSTVAHRTVGLMALANGINGTMAGIHYAQHGETGYQSVGDFAAQGVRLAAEMGVAGVAGRGVTGRAGAPAGFAAEAGAFAATGGAFSHSEIFSKPGETPMGFGNFDDALVDAAIFMGELRLAKGALNGLTLGNYDLAVRELESDLESQRRGKILRPEPVLDTKQGEFFDYETQSAASGLFVVPEEGTDLVQVAKDVIENYGRDEMRNPHDPSRYPRMVLDTQQWVSVPLVTEDLLSRLKQLVEDHDVIICLKTTDPNYLAVEIEPDAIAERHKATGPLAAAPATDVVRQLVDEMQRGEVPETSLDYLVKARSIENILGSYLSTFENLSFLQKLFTKPSFKGAMEFLFQNMQVHASSRNIDPELPEIYRPLFDSRIQCPGLPEIYEWSKIYDVLQSRGKLPQEKGVSIGKTEFMTLAAEIFYDETGQGKVPGLNLVSMPLALSDQITELTPGSDQGITVGRDSDYGLPIGDKQFVSRQHFSIRRLTDDTWQLDSIGKNGVLIQRGKHYEFLPPDLSFTLSNGDIIIIGDSVGFRFSVPESAGRLGGAVSPPSDPTVPPSSTRTVLSMPQGGESVELRGLEMPEQLKQRLWELDDGDSFFLGRRDPKAIYDATQGLSIPPALDGKFSVSRRHLLIQRGGNDFYLSDTSMFGTRVFREGQETPFLLTHTESREHDRLIRQGGQTGELSLQDGDIIVLPGITDEELEYNFVFRHPPTPLQRARKNPKVGGQDTIVGFNPDGSPRSEHNPDLDFVFIQDDEIVDFEAAPDTHSRVLENVPYGITADGRYVIQQQGQRGCVAACMAMMAMQHGKKPDMAWVKSCNTSSLERAVSVLNRSGLPTVLTDFYKEWRDGLGSLSSEASDARVATIREGLPDRLEKLISENGSGFLLLGGHMVVLDSFSMSKNQAVIRDPFHGWSITITVEALMKEGPSDLVQVKNVFSPRILSGLAHEGATADSDPNTRSDGPGKTGSVL